MSKGKNYYEIAILISIVLILLTSCTNSDSITSRIDEISDEVYEYILEDYFLLLTDYRANVEEQEELIDCADDMWEHAYEEAKKYEENHDDIDQPLSTIPNRLLYDYHKNPDQFNDTEKQYIERIIEMDEAFSNFSFDEYNDLQKQFKKDFKIKESDNMYCPI